MLEIIRVLEKRMYDLEKRLWKVKLTTKINYDTRQQLDSMENEIKEINTIIGSLRRLIGDF